MHVEKTITFKRQFNTMKKPWKLEKKKKKQIKQWHTWGQDAHTYTMHLRDFQ